MFNPPKGHLRHVCCLLLFATLLSCGGGADATAPKALPKPADPPLPPIAKIVLSASGGTTLNPNSSRQITARVFDSNSGELFGNSITYASSSSTIADVSQTGLVTSKAVAGTVNITGSIGSVTSDPLTITVPNLVGIPKTISKVRSPAITLTVGTSDSVTVKVVDYFNSPVAGATVTFTGDSECGSTAPQVSTTDASGIAGAVIFVRTQSSRTCTLTASSSQATTTSFTSTSVAGPGVSVSLSPSNDSRIKYASVSVGGIFNVDVIARDIYGNPASASRTLVSRNMSIASWPSSTSSNSVVPVTGIAGGQTFLVATVGTSSDSILVGVAPALGAVAAVALPRPDLKTDTTFMAIVSFVSGPPAFISSTTVTVNWDPSLLTFVSDDISGVSGSIVVNTTNAAAGALTISYAYTGGGARFYLRHLYFRAKSTPGLTGAVRVTVKDISSDTFADLLPLTYEVSYPLILR